MKYDALAILSKLADFLKVYPVAMLNIPEKRQKSSMARFDIAVTFTA